jgi:LemA protein
MEYAFFIALGAIALIGVWFWATYNGLVALNERVEEAWSDITIQLKRRADLIPNLIEAVKGYAKHEKEVFEGVTQARAATISPEAMKSPKSAAKADAGFAGALKSLFAVAEAYPVLQASQNFLALQADLSDTEDKIMSARRFYNAGARELNIKIKQFPQVIFAGFGFKEREYFEVADLAAIAEAPQVKF